jgi:hypothetical protein
VSKQIRFGIRETRWRDCGEMINLRMYGNFARQNFRRKFIPFVIAESRDGLETTISHIFSRNAQINAGVHATAQ